MTTTKLLNNDYPSDLLKCLEHSKNSLLPKAERPTTKTQCILRAPFVTDRFNHVRHLLKKHEIPARLVNLKGQTIQELVRSKPNEPTKPCRSRSCPAPGICHATSVVYCATCTICEEFHIGMTTRRLHARAREHLAAAKQHLRASVCGDHYVKSHPKAVPNIQFKIIKHQRNDLHLHIEEALTIKALRPTLNRRQEDVGTGFLP